MLFTKYQKAKHNLLLNETIYNQTTYPQYLLIDVLNIIYPQKDKTENITQRMLEKRYTSLLDDIATLSNNYFSYVPEYIPQIQASIETVHKSNQRHPFLQTYCYLGSQFTSQSLFRLRLVASDIAHQLNLQPIKSLQYSHHEINSIVWFDLVRCVEFGSFVKQSQFPSAK